LIRITSYLRAARPPSRKAGRASRTSLFFLLDFGRNFRPQRVEPDKAGGVVRVEITRVHGKAMFSTWNEYVFNDSGVAS